MLRVSFTAYGHENIVGDHHTTVELTSEGFLTPQGTCIIGILSTMTLSALDDDIKIMAASKDTKITLKLRAGGITDAITGWGSPGLNYTDSTSMVARTSDYKCGRTLMVRADKAASDISRELVAHLKKRDNPIQCELVFTTQ